MPHFKLLLSLLLLSAACVSTLPLEGAPCPCSPGLMCGSDGKCHPAPDGASADAESPGQSDGPAVPSIDDQSVSPDGPSPDGPSTDAAAGGADPCAYEPPVVGCGDDDLAYASACDARSAGTGFHPGAMCRGTGECGLYSPTAVGSCDRTVGWLWGAAGCQALVGCACSGSGCETLYPTLGTCQRAHLMCNDEYCKGDTVVCRDDKVCLRQGPNRCGRDGSQGSCVPRPVRCPAENTPVCGCDGKSYPGPCAAQRAGTDLDHDGPCSASADAGVPSMDGPDNAVDCSFEPFVGGCGADHQVYGNACDARTAGTAFTPGNACWSTGSCGVYPDMHATGSCDRVLGWAWSGTMVSSCQPLIGCACTGDGCQTLYATLGACERAHYMCKSEYCKGDTIVCAPDQACTHPGPNRCGRDGARGYCVPRPATCPHEVRSVCGCDGKSYPGECAARAAGTDIDHLGPCM